MIKYLFPASALALILTAPVAYAQNTNTNTNTNQNQAADNGAVVAGRDAILLTAVDASSTFVDKSRTFVDNSALFDASINLNGDYSFFAQPVASGFLSGAVYDTQVTLSNDAKQCCNYDVDADAKNKLLLDQSIDVSGSAITNIQGVNTIAVNSGINVMQQSNIAISAVVNGGGY